MKTFAAFLIERAAADAITTVISHGQHRDISAPNFGIQFILPDGEPIELGDAVHARVTREAGQKAGLDIQLIDVLEAGVVRAAAADMYQVGSAISSAQAQFMFDRASMRSRSIIVSVADAEWARGEAAGTNRGIGPIEINDKDTHEFDLSRIKPATVRNWVNQHYA